MKSFRSMLMATCLMLPFFIACQSELIEIHKINPTIRVQLRYTTKNNFTGEVIYPKNTKAYLLKEVAHALNNVQKELEKQGLGLLIWDAYRPPTAQKKLWNIYPDKRYVSPPETGNRTHLRGVAVDVTLVHLKTGKELAMPTPFDSFCQQAWAHESNISVATKKNRTLLQNVMTKHGFETIKTEWWHFNYKNWQKYPIIAINFKQLV